MFKRILLAMILSCGFLTSPLHAEVMFKNYIPVVEARPEAKAVASYTDKVTELTAGDVKFTNYHVGGLGFKTTDLLRHMKLNTVQGGVILGAYYPRDVPAFSVMFVDGIALQASDATKFTDIFTEIADKAMNKWNIKLTAMYQVPIMDHSMFFKKPVTSLEQLKKLKLRVWTKHQLLSFKSLGVPAQLIPQGDLYVALQTGVVDGAIFLAEVAHTLALQEVAKYETYMLPLVMAPAAIGVSGKAWKKLDKKNQDAVLAAGDWLTKKSLKDAVMFGENKTKYRQARKDMGFVMTEGFSAADTATIVKALRDTWLEMCADVSPEALANANRIMAKMPN
jgi:TRAP-type C4-dicarboxylate transport system substrate-binding protein